MRPNGSVAQADFEDRSRDMEETSWWDHWNTSYRINEGVDPTSTELFQHAASLVKQFSPHGRLSHMLEIACGTGTLSRQLQFASYHGIDLSPAAISLAEQKAQDLRLTGVVFPAIYEACDFLAWPVPSRLLDVILIVDAIACMKDQRIVLQKAAQLLAPGGICILTTPNPIVYHRIRRTGGVRLENGPISRWLTRGELLSLISAAGLHPIYVHSIMPRGNMGFLRLVNSHRLNHMFGPVMARMFRRLKEEVGLGQYHVIVANKY